MSSGSLSVSESLSASGSDVCCFPVTCACQDWLTSFCEYEVLTLTACGEEYEYERGRRATIPFSAVNPQHGVFAADEIFRVSMLEHSVDILPGATILDSSGTTWQVYRVEDLASFCVKKLWARSVRQCFQMVTDVEVYSEDVGCTDCGTVVGYQIDAIVKGTVVCETGSLATSNDQTRMNYRYSAVLEEWPLDHKPRSTNILRVGLEEYRILSFVDQGPYLPFSMTLEPRRDDCDV